MAVKITFEYSKEKDIWCLLNKGKNSNNSPNPTKVYEQLVASCGGNLTENATSAFIEKYLKDNNVEVQEYITHYQKDWDSIADEYQKRAEALFKVSLPNNVMAYLTVNNRSPYNIEENFFYVSVPAFSVKMVVMHELWHFYTWYGLGPNEEERLGMQQYNDLKESLTVLLNIECKDLLPKGSRDGGYPQHKEIREKILEFWAKDKNISNLWEYLTK